MATWNRELSLEVERRWASDELRTLPDTERLAHEVLAVLEARFPGALGRRDLALQEILRDILRIRRVLSYGGRSPAALPPARRAQLESLRPLKV